ncbi:IS110 family transposase [Pontibacterium sp.]|uniref:IS110 family transposase n=1 Tax=Pontibacterium sp. TaxID=2036026 RepID=UPI003517C5B5
MNQISILGIDLAKSVFQLHGIDVHGHRRLSKQVRRACLMKTVAQLPSCLIAMEACGGAYYWAREFEALGHQVKLIPPQYVKPFVQVNKNDVRDAQAIAEAAARPATPTVPQKSVEQQDIQAIHRVRERLIRERTAVANELRGLLAEVGVVIPCGNVQIAKHLTAVLDQNQDKLSGCRHRLIEELRQQWLERDHRITMYDGELKRLAQQEPSCALLQTIPGIGPVNATLLYSYVGSVSSYRSGRHLSAALGLVPKQYASGGKTVLKGISKQGNTHVRRQLIHGARAAYKVLSKPGKSSALRDWVQRKQGKHPNKIIVALANKLARICWAVLKKQTPYQAEVSVA